MIQDNVVDLTGFAFNIMVKPYDKFTSIFFTLNVANRYKREGEYVNDYEVIPCVISSSKNEDGKHSNSFEKLNKELVENLLVRVQGRITSWQEGIKDNQLIPVNPDNKDSFSKIITRNMVRITDYKLLETKEKALARSKKYHNQTHENLPQESKESPVEDTTLSTEEVAEQVEMKMVYFPDFEVPQYKNMTI